MDEIGTVFNNKTFSYRSLFEQTKHGRLTGRFGFEGFNREYEVNGAEQLIQGKVKHNAFSVFGLEELNFKRVKFQFGGRVESNRYDPESIDLLDRSYRFFGWIWRECTSVERWSRHRQLFTFLPRPARGALQQWPAHRQRYVRDR